MNWDELNDATYDELREKVSDLQTRNADLERQNNGLAQQVIEKTCDNDKLRARIHQLESEADAITPAEPVDATVQLLRAVRDDLVIESRIFQAACHNLIVEVDKLKSERNEARLQVDEVRAELEEARKS